jgi:plastocyanin
MRRRTLLRWILLATLAAMLALLVACGDDDDDGGGDELSEEDYFARMDEIDKDLDAQFDEVFSNEEATAGDLAEGYESAISSASDQYPDVNPPEEHQERHDTLVDEIDNYSEALDSATEDLDADAEASEFEAVFANDDLAAAEEEVNAAFCAIQDAADEAGIEADVGCEEEGEEDGEDPASLPPEETTENEIIEFVFTPQHMQVSVGDTVTWTNQDEAPHTATADDDSFDTGTLSQGDSGEVTFEEAGTFTYFCEIHPDMLGAVTVVE